MLKVLVDYDKHAPAIAKELAATDNGAIVVSWAELELAGILSISDLFTLFARGRIAVERLAKSVGIFGPPPYTRFDNLRNELFVPAPFQPVILEGWKKNLDDFTKSLAIK